MNQVIMIGFLGQDAELKQLEKSSLLRFSVATDDGYYDQKNKEWISKTTWHNIVAWGKIAESNAVLSKGDKVLIMGRLVSRDYKKDDNTNQRIVEVNAYKIEKMEHNKKGVENEPIKLEGLPF